MELQTQIDYQQLAIALMAQSIGARQKTVSSTPTTVYGHGPSGLFSTRGLSKPLFSALLLPSLGLQSVLPVKPSVEANPLHGIFTGVTATTGSEPTGVCDPPPVAGMSKLCTHSFVFGRQSRMTRVFELDRLGLRTNRAEFDDLEFRGNPFQTGAQANVPTIPGMNIGQVAQKEVAKALFELAVAWSRDFAVETYTGNPTNNTGGGGRKYFYGLDILINTGYRDAETGIACPAADSIVRTFGNLNISEGTANGETLVRQVTNILRNLHFISSRAGLDPTNWAIAMSWALFYEVTAVWPCSYQTYRCSLAGTNNTAFSDRDAMTRMTDDMRGDIYNRTGQYLLVDGARIPVIIDDAITETVGAGEVFTSAMYFVPMTVLGGEPVTYIEYKPQDGEVLEGAQAFAPDGSFYASDNGRFLWARRPPELFCTQLVAKTEPRIILLTPHLAARLTNIVYAPLVHQRGWQTTDTSFYVDGGRTDDGGYGPSYSSPTA